MIRKLLAVCMVLCLLAPSGFARQLVMDPGDVEAIRVMGPNGIPVKVLVVLDADDNADFVAGLIKLVEQIHVIDKIPQDQQFKVHVVPVSDADRALKVLQEKVDKKILDKYVEFNKTFVLRQSDIWMQDWGEIGMVKLKNEAKAKLLVIDSNRGRGIGELPAVLANFWNCYYLKNPSNDQACGDYGGNIEVTPDDVLIIGNTSTKKLREFFSSRGYKDRLIIVESDWLQVGHCDEFLSIAPNPKAPNKYSIIKANPRLALRLIEKASRAELEKIPVDEYREMLLAVHEYLNRARSSASANRTGLPAVMPNIDGNNPEVVRGFPRRVLNLLDSTNRNGDLPPRISGEAQRHLAVASTRSSIRDLKVEEFIKTNLALATLIDNNIQEISKKISTVNCEPDIRHSVLSFPVLYHKVGYGKHIAYVPGVVNQLILRRHLVIPDPQVSVFRDHITTVADKAGLSAHFLDAMHYHKLSGEIHCGTNVFRHPNKYIVPPKNLPDHWKKLTNN